MASELITWLTLTGFAAMVALAVTPEQEPMTIDVHQTCRVYTGFGGVWLPCAETAISLAWREI